MTESGATKSITGRFKSPFWSAAPPFGQEYGLFHESDINDRGFFPGVLFVFVHGINSNAIACWRGLPEEILLRLGRDADILNFQYPSHLLANISIEEAASQLQTLLCQLVERFKYRDIIFLVHSAGGLVLKQLLITDFHNGKILFSRTRQIFNYGVPHMGSIGGLAEFSRRAAVLLELVLSPLTGFLRFVSQGSIRLGRNQILLELKHRGAYVISLENQYVRILAEQDRTKQPRPESIEISGDGDVVSDGGDISSRATQVRLRDTHVSVKTSEIGLHTVTERVAIKKLWKERRREWDAMAARMMVERVEIIEHATGTRTIISEPEKNAANAGGFDQNRCLVILESLLNDPSKKRIVLSGPVGVGKSVVLRSFCRDVCKRFGHGQPLVLFFPIDRLILAAGEDVTDGPSLQLALCRAWVKQANDLFKGTSSSITLSWLLDRLKLETTIIILDGIDEFIANHPRITSQSVLSALSVDKGDTTRADVRVIIGARESWWGLETLCRGSIQLKLAPLDQSTLLKSVPHLALIIERMKPADRQILSTPLVVNALSRMNHEIKEHSATRILREAVEGILESSRLLKDPITLEPLALLAWIYYRRFRRDLSLEEISEEAERILSEWRQDLTAGSGSDASSQSKCDCLDHLKLVSNTESLSRLLKLPFFFPTKESCYSLSNEAWRDFFVTLYLSLCVRHNHATGLGGIAFHVDHYRRAGDLLVDFRVDEQLVSTFVSRAQTGDDPFIVGNLASVLGVSDVPVVTAASRRVAQACGQPLHPLGTFVATGRLAGRAAKSKQTNGDFASVDIRTGLRQVLPGAVSQQGGSKLIRSLFLCCLRELGIRMHSAIDLDADEPLDWVQDNSPASGERARSVQMSFLSAQYTTKEYPEHSVAHVHYLFLLTVARIQGWAIPEVCEQLPSFLEAGSETESHYRTYDSVPELYDIYRKCQTLWQRYSAPTTELPATREEIRTKTATSRA